ncbi:MAG: molybdopterin-dependent oxidoreductase [Candidatus Latescibacteria bacterium]|nr:molybdopterin-dependent oxidoreductase [Candidatus Latescibacterota bacterium]
MLVQKKSTCMLCSVGCEFIIETIDDEAVNLEYDKDNPVTGGVLCAKGNYMLELINHPLRLIEPQINGKVVDWNEAIRKTSDELLAHREKSDAGIILAGDASVEDAKTAELFAETCLGTGRLAIYFATGDDTVQKALTMASIPNRAAGLNDIGKSTCTIAVGNPFEVGPVIAGKVLKARYARRGNIFGVISNKENMTSRFATIHHYGNERKLLSQLLRVVADRSEGDELGLKKLIKELIPATENPDVVKLGEAFVKSPSSVLILETQDPVKAQLASAVVSVAGADKRLFCVNTYGNAKGICEAVKSTVSVNEIITAVDHGVIKTLIVLGTDIVKGIPGRNIEAVLEKLDFLAVGAPFGNETKQSANVIFPTALWLETEGIYNGKHLQPVIDPPGAALPYGDILRQLAEAMGKALPQVTPEPVEAPQQLNEETLRVILKESMETVPEPAVQSTVTQFADGSLTSNIQWLQLQERDAW